MMFDPLAMCRILPMSGDVLAKVNGVPSGWATTKGTLQFPPDTPPSTALVKRLVRTRLEEMSDMADGKRFEFYDDGPRI